MALGDATTTDSDTLVLVLQRRLANLKLLIIDELGFVPLSKTEAELLFEAFSQRYESGSVLVTSNLPFAPSGPRPLALNGLPEHSWIASLTMSTSSK
jgi:hypothetical protein